MPIPLPVDDEASEPLSRYALALLIAMLLDQRMQTNWQPSVLAARIARYATAWAYLTSFVVADIVVAALSPAARSAVLQLASTNVVNLRHDPLGCLVASAFVPDGGGPMWPLLIALAMFGANRALGNWGAATVCCAGHVVGTLVSEGIVAYRVGHGLLPASDLRILDVGPSYVVVAAAVIAVLRAPRLARVAAAADLVLLVAVGGIFNGLGTLQVAAVGHTTSIIVALMLGWLSARRAPPPGNPSPCHPRARDLTG